MDIFDQINKNKKEKKTKTKSKDKKSKKAKEVPAENVQVAEEEQPQVEVAATNQDRENVPAQPQEESNEDGWLDDENDNSQEDVALAGKLAKIEVKKTKTVITKDDQTGEEKEEEVEVDENDEDQSKQWDLNRLHAKKSDLEKEKPSTETAAAEKAKSSGMSFQERMRLNRSSAGNNSLNTGFGGLVGGPKRTRNKIALDDKTLNDTNIFPTLGTTKEDKATPKGFTSVSTHSSGIGE